MTASSGGSLAIHVSGKAMSPAIGVAPHCASFAAAASERASANNSCPRPTSCRTTAEPIRPVPPRTNTRTICPLCGSPPTGWRGARSSSRVASDEYCDAARRGLKISQSKSDAKSGAQIFFAICFGLIEPAQHFSPATDVLPFCRSDPPLQTKLASNVQIKIITGAAAEITQGYIGSDAMKSAFNRSILALTAILVVAGASQANAQQKPLKKYELGHQGILDPSAGRLVPWR